MKRRRPHPPARTASRTGADASAVAPGGRPASLPSSGSPSAPPPIGTVYWLTFSDVAFRLRMSRQRLTELRKRDPNFPKAVQAPGCAKRYVEAEVGEYVRVLIEDRDR